MAQPTYSAQRPLSQRISALHHRLGQTQGHPQQRQEEQRRLQRLQAQRFFHQQRNQPLPFSAQYDTTVGQLRNERNQSLDQLAGERSALSSQFGVGDTSNPYSEARQLEASYAAKRAGTINSAAGSGQLYSGSTSNALNYASQNFGQAEDSMLRDYEAKQSDLSNQGLAAKNKFVTGRNEAMATRLQDAVNATPDPTEGSLPKNVNRFVNRQQRRARSLQQQGHTARSNAILNRLSRMS